MLKKRELLTLKAARLPGIEASGGSSGRSLTASLADSQSPSTPELDCDGSCTLPYILVIRQRICHFSVMWRRDEAFECKHLRRRDERPSRALAPAPPRPLPALSPLIEFDLDLIGAAGNRDEEAAEWNEAGTTSRGVHVLGLVCVRLHSVLPVQRGAISFLVDVH
ncbi:hypothetical protein INR49_009558, partial [Caranx melampygus]